jgi:DNA end-binding protein Ku
MAKRAAKTKSGASHSTRGAKTHAAGKAPHAATRARGKHEPANDTEEPTRRGARPFWSGTLSFGLVSIPVDFFAAERHGGVRSHWLAPDGVPVKRRYFCPRDEEEVSGEHLVRGLAQQDGSYVAVSDDELDALDPEHSSDIALQLFVSADAVDPLYFERGYYLGFSEGSGKAYRLLAEVMESTHRAGIATLVMRGKEHVVAIFAEGGLLTAQTLRFHDEVRAADDAGTVDAEKVPHALAEQARKAIASLAEDALDLEELRDQDSARLQKLVEEKAHASRDLVEVEQLPAEREAPVVDLLDILKRSLRESAGKRS